MVESSAWDEISIPGADFNVRQVASKTAVPCYWGRDSSGACLFILELQGNHEAQYRKDNVTVHGIHVDLRVGASNRQHLILTLEQQIDRDLFEGLCRTLITALELATDSATSLAIAQAHIRRWKTFLSGRGGQRLSMDEVRGLFAELTFLEELIENVAPRTAAIEAWLGPERSHQDFIFANTAVEIKSLSGTERSTVRISSEDQLESLNDALFLRIYRLSNLPTAPGARSLNDIIAAVEKKLGDSGALTEFERKLASHGYAPLPDYDEPAFVVSEDRTYRVEAEFPRLVRSGLPDGVTKVAYDIELESLAPCQCERTTVFRGI